MRTALLALLLLDVSPKEALPRGVVASWSFHRSGGARDERSGRKLDLVDVKLGREGLEVQRGYAITKDEKVGAVNGAFSIESWTKFDKHNYFWALVAVRGVRGAGQFGESFGLYVSQQGQAYFTVNGRALQTGQSVPMGEWVHLAATIGADGEMKVYVNGKECAAGRGPERGMADRGGPFYVGGSDVIPCPVDFTVRTVRLYNRALAPKELEKLAKAKR